MKVQYFGDKHDFRKYVLLRLLAKTFNIGVCWMLTPDDGGSDGEKRKYLKGEDWRVRSPEVFDLLRNNLVDEKTGELIKPTCSHLKIVRNLVPNAIDFEIKVPSKKQDRKDYHSKTLATFKNTNLVFYDPDNGIEVKSCPLGRKKSNKYVYCDELSDHHKSGRSLLVYQHFPRTAHEQVIEMKRRQMEETLPNAKTWAFETTDVVFLLAVQPHHAELITTLESDLQHLTETGLYKALHKPS